MALLKYFKRAEPTKNEKIDSVLPKVDGPLGKLMPMSAIRAANTAVRAKLLESRHVTEADAAAGSDGDTIKHRGRYQIFTSKERAEYGRRAAEYGITPAIRHFAKVDLKHRTLSPSTIFAWKENYLKELAKRKHDEEPEVKELPPKKRGRPLLIGPQLDDRVQVYVKEMRKTGVVINTAVVMAAAEGIVKHHDANLIEDDGPITITKDWARSLLTRMHFVKRRANSKAKVSVPEFDRFKEQFAYDARVIAEFEEIPDRLVINWDHTAYTIYLLVHGLWKKKAKREWR